jgi:fucose permease
MHPIRRSMVSSTLLVAIAFLSYVAIGLPGGVLGVAWPSIRASFSLSLDAIGTMFIARTAGYFLAGYSNGQLVSRLGIGRFVALSGMIGALGVLGYALAPSWAVMVLCALAAGIGTGAIDAGMNTYFAANHSPSLMNWLHACFGLGAALSPAMTAAMLGSGYSWRWSYVVVAAALGLTALCFALTARSWRLDKKPQNTGEALAEPGSTESDSSQTHVRAMDTLRLPAAWLAITMFFVFTGLEVSGGQWPYTLFTEARAVAPATAGFWVSAYWASLTIGRILFGLAARRIRLVQLLRMAMLGCVCGTALIWWNPTQTISFLGLALLGFALAPIFPLSISDTPRQLGARHAPNAIGFQVAAASLGIAVLPGLGGVLAERAGLETIGPYLVVLAVGMFLLHELFVRWGARHTQTKPQKRPSLVQGA